MFGPQFEPAAPALIVLLWSIPVAFFRNVPQTALIAAGRQEWVFRVTLVSAVLNLALNLALIPRWGMMGAATATLATETIRTILTLLRTVQAGFPLPSPVRFWRVTLAAIVMAGGAPGRSPRLGPARRPTGRGGLRSRPDGLWRYSPASRYLACIGVVTSMTRKSQLLMNLLRVGLGVALLAWVIHVTGGVGALESLVTVP